MISNAECVHVMKDKVARQNVHLSCMHRALHVQPPALHGSDIMTFPCYPSTWEAEAG